MNWTSWLSGVWAALLSVILAIFSIGGTGCAPQATELERFNTGLMTEVIAPAVQKALTETAVRTATIQGGAQAVEPGYLVDVSGFFGTGVQAKALVKVVGVSGQLTGHIQGDQGPDLTKSGTQGQGDTGTEPGGAPAGKTEDPTAPVG